jgi:hypothetical protein
MENEISSGPRPTCYLAFLAARCDRRPGFSSIYFLLDKLHDRGLIAEVEQEAPPRGKARRVFEATAEGTRVCAEAAEVAIAELRPVFPPVLVGLANEPEYPVYPLTNHRNNRRYGRRPDPLAPDPSRRSACRSLRQNAPQNVLPDERSEHPGEQGGWSQDIGTRLAQWWGRNEAASSR